MKPQIAGCARTAIARAAIAMVAIAIVLGAASDADAAVWAWGCKGKVGANQLILNRNMLALLEGKPTKLALKDVVHRDDPVADEPDAVRFNPADFNSGFEEKTMEFTKADEPGKKLVLTEKSSRQTSSHNGRVAFRDETWTVWKKVFRYALDGEPPRDVTLECMEYMLSTKGGRG